MTGDDVYACWRAALKGEILPADRLLPTGLGGVDGHPQPGLYRKRDGGGYQDGKRQPHKWVPVKVFLVDDTGTVVHKWATGLTISAIVGRDQTVDPIKIWSWCQTRDKTGTLVTVNAITQATYKYWLEHERWPDDVPALEPTIPQPGTDVAHVAAFHADSGTSPAGIGHNSGDDPAGIDALLRVVQQQSHAVDEWLKVEREGNSAGNTAGNWLDELRKIEAKVTAGFVAEKAPHLAECQRIDDKWRAIKALAASVKKRMADALTVIGEKEKRRLQKIAEAEAMTKAAAIRAKQEADRARQIEDARIQREAAQKAAGAAPIEPEPEPDLPLPPLPEPVVAVEKVKVSFGGAAGRKIGLTSKSSAVITDWKAAAAHYAMAPKVQDVVQALANADAKNGIACPGASISVKDVAA